MIRQVQASANTELDRVFELLSEALQPTPSEWADADEKYHAAADWLSAPTSQLYIYRPDIKYQGSALLGTVTRPWLREEFDVDLLCILQTSRFRNPDPMVLYNMVANRLAEHATYRRLMKRKARCIELNYAGQFHLDIVPAIPSGVGQGLFIPDREQRLWIATYPFEYAVWFYGRTPVIKSGAKYEARAEAAPLPPARRAKDISPLQRTVQLFKRRRDLYFKGSDAAPKSIALTTLAGKHYGGEPLCTDALLAVLYGIQTEIDNSRGILVVPNPVDPTENLGRHWNEVSYLKFKRFIRQFINEMCELLEISGWERITKMLEEMFGDRGRQAVKKYAENFEEQRRANGLGYRRGPSILAPAIVTTSTPVRRHEFYGS
jgi:hypothetical protein